MREILFRGYSEEYGWIYGDYAAPNGIHSANIFPYKDSNIIEGIAVDPKSVGQYTGLTDRNGKKIFEGDIIKDFWINGMLFLFVVKYSNKYCAFAVKNKHEYLDNGDGVLGVGELSREKEVIGNIYDNPELLKGAKEDD